MRGAVVELIPFISQPNGKWQRENEDLQSV
jgi:hypothetical protein